MGSSLFGGVIAPVRGSVARMWRTVFSMIALLAILGVPVHSGAARPHRIGASASHFPRIRLQTSAGPIVIQLDMKRAPITAGNFLRYVEEKRFDGTSFYRAARSRKSPKFGLVQGGINHKVVRARLPIPHEPTSRTGIRHVDGTVSMARNAPGSAMGDFFVTVGPASYLDAQPGSVGYAAFGQVVEGMSVIRRILSARTYPGGWSKDTVGQTIVSPVRILTARRIS